MPTRQYQDRSGICVVCLMLRKCTPEGTVTFHRMWVPDTQFGHMEDCLGSGQLPLPKELEEYGNANDK